MRQVARGWRWRPAAAAAVGRAAYVVPPSPSEFPTDWARSRAGGRGARGDPARRARPRCCAPRRTLKVAGLDVLDGIDGPVIFVANHSSHLDTAAAAALAAADVAAAGRGRRGGRLLLRHLVAGGRVGAGLQHVPDRARRRRPVGDPARAARRRLVAGDVPRGHPLAGRLDPPVPAGRGLPRRAGRRAGRAGRASSGRSPRCRAAAAGPSPGGPRCTSASASRCSRARARSRATFGARIDAAVATLLDEDRSDWYAAALRAAERRHATVDRVRDVATLAPSLGVDRVTDDTASPRQSLALVYPRGASMAETAAHRALGVGYFNQAWELVADQGPYAGTGPRHAHDGIRVERGTGSTRRHGREPGRRRLAGRAHRQPRSGSRTWRRRSSTAAYERARARELPTGSKRRPPKDVHAPTPRAVTAPSYERFAAKPRTARAGRRRRRTAS